MPQLLRKLIGNIRVRTSKLLNLLFSRSADPSGDSLQLDLNNRISVLDAMVLDKQSGAIQAHQGAKFRVFVTKIEFVLEMLES